MFASQVSKVVFSAIALCALAFTAGVMGDLSQASVPTNHGERVTLVIPPDAPRAHPLPPLPRTEAASAHVRSFAQRAQRRVKPQAEQKHAGPKVDPDYAPKPQNAKRR